MGETRLVGAASDVPIATRAEVDIDLEGKREGLLAAAARNTPSRWYLRVEDVRGRNPATPAYDVYLNDRRVGSIASFGIPEATEPRGGEHGGTGLTLGVGGRGGADRDGAAARLASSGRPGARRCRRLARRPGAAPRAAALQRAPGAGDPRPARVPGLVPGRAP
ncbi:MAG: hypothetical protein ACJ76M_03755 [Solirubrobacteraceae bacterium]